MYNIVKLSKCTQLLLFFERNTFVHKYFLSLTQKKMTQTPKLEVVNSSATKVLSVRIPTTDYLRFFSDAEKSGLTMSEYLQYKLYTEVKESHTLQSIDIAQAELERLTQERDILQLNSPESAKKLLQVVKELNEAKAEIERLNEVITETENANNTAQLESELSETKDSLQAITEELAKVTEQLQVQEALNEKTAQAYNEAARLTIKDIDADTGFSTSKTFRDNRFNQFTQFFNSEIEKRNNEPEIEAETNDLPATK